jgi:hypothetical protein
MTLRLAHPALAALVALGLVACVPTSTVPSGPSDEETAAIIATRIDQAWANTGLEGRVERPSVQRESEPATFDQLAECFATEGISGWGLSDGATGPALTVEGGATDAELASFYWCFARYPTDTPLGTLRFTDEQLEYLYDYYRSWVIPCLALSSVEISSVPTREQFLSGNWSGWTPYDHAEALSDEDAYHEAVRTCGDKYGRLDVYDPFAR